MKNNTARLIFIISIILTVFSASLKAQDRTLMIEAEKFQFSGGWYTEKISSTQEILRVAAGGTVADAITAVSIPRQGTYHVWGYTRDYATNNPGTRTSTLFVNSQVMTTMGKHKREGYYWEKVGTVVLEAGECLLRLHVPLANYARVDALLLTTSSFLDPNVVGKAALTQFTVKPVDAVVHDDSSDIPEDDIITNDYFVKSTLVNQNIKFNVLASSDVRKPLCTKVYYNDAGTWRSLKEKVADCNIWLNMSKTQTVTYSNYFPSWTNSSAKKYIMLDGIKYYVSTQEDTGNPYFAGTRYKAIPIAVVAASADSVKLKYRLNTTDSLFVTWRLSPNDSHLDAKVTYLCADNQYYGVIFDGLQDVDNISNVQLAPLYTNQQLPASPNLATLFMTPQPVSIVEFKNSSANKVSYFVTTDPDEFSREWYADNLGLGLKNIRNKIQPMAVSPIPGTTSSLFARDSELKVTFKVGVMAKEWTKTQQYVSDNIFKVYDYRKQLTSLNNAIFNMVDLLKDDFYSGWSEKRKGFLDIESDPASLTVAAHAAPLALLSANVLNQDEDFYIKRTLPSIEYTLSRRGFRWGLPKANTTTPSIVSFYPFSSEFNTAYFEGLYSLLSSKNDWIKEIAMPNGEPRYSKGYRVDETWTGDIAAYKLTDDANWLNLAKTKADEFIEKEVYGSRTEDASISIFYNAYYPQWFDLLDLYDITGDEKYYNAAKYSAYYTTAGVRSYPPVKNDNQTIHPNNKYAGVTAMWWKENELYRLGYPRVAGDVKEKTVPSWQVSGVGLGIEQPRSLFPRIVKDIYYVFMNNWAPSLLRLNKNGDDNYFDAYARNAVIGRFANYPGYYIAGYTDLTLDAQFPYKGPDISSIYYHHIPPHLAMTIDFLFTEVVERSKGRIYFPYSRQEGFVSFNNRLYGRSGTIDGVKVKPILKKGVISLDNEEINYLTAISSDKFWVVLLNESEAASNVNVAVNGFGDYVGATSQLHSVEGKGIKIINFPLSKSFEDVQEALPAVDSGFKVVDLGSPFGKLFLYRIRSPFGWDSIYGFLSENVDKPECFDLKIGLCEKGKEAETSYSNSFPYEWSFIKVANSSKITIMVKVKDGQSDIYTKEIEI